MSTSLPRTATDLEMSRPESNSARTWAEGIVAPWIDKWTVEDIDDTSPRTNADKCQELIEEPHYSNAFRGKLLKFEGEPLPVGSDTNLKVALMVHYRRKVEAMRSELLIPMTDPPVREFVEKLASFGTGYLAHFELGSYTVTWRFVDLSDRDLSKGAEGYGFTELRDNSEERRQIARHQCYIEPVDERPLGATGIMLED